MEDLLEATIKAHGGHERWNGVRPVTVSFNYYGALLDLKTWAKTGFVQRRDFGRWTSASTLKPNELPELFLNSTAGLTNWSIASV